MNFSLIFENYSVFLTGIGITTLLVIVPLIFGFFLALFNAIVIVERVPILRWFCSSYSLVFRGSPLLVQGYLIYYGLAQFEWMRESWAWVFFREAYFCVILTFALNTGAYTTEFFRTGILNTPLGELEAGKTLGFSKFQLYRKIIIPSMLRRVMPLYGNEVIYLLHATSIASVFTLIDITGAARWLNASYNTAYEGMGTAALIYICFTYLVVVIFKQLEKTFGRYLTVKM